MQGWAPGSPGRAQARPNLPSHVVGFQVDELERKVKSQQDQLFLTRQELTNTSAELKMRAIQAEERLELEKKRSRQSLEDSEHLRFKEVPC